MCYVPETGVVVLEIGLQFGGIFTGSRLSLGLDGLRIFDPGQSSRHDNDTIMKQKNPAAAILRSVCDNPILWSKEQSRFSENGSK